MWLQHGIEPVPKDTAKQKQLCQSFGHVYELFWGGESPFLTQQLLSHRSDCGWDPVIVLEEREALRMSTSTGSKETNPPSLALGNNWNKIFQWPWGAGTALHHYRSMVEFVWEFTRKALCSSWNTARFQARFNFDRKRSSLPSAFSFLFSCAGVDLGSENTHVPVTL